MPELPPHHSPRGGYRNPWPPSHDPHREGGFLRWRWERLGSELAPDPDPSEVPREEPRPSIPRSALSELRVTWIGHATFLVQIGGYNLLTDPVWSDRASPVRWAGPRRFRPPGMSLQDLPPIDSVLLTHGHYDHLDDATVRWLAERWSDAPVWHAPLGWSHWLGRRGATRVVELDWWEGAELAPAGPDAKGGPHARREQSEPLPLRITAVPARHWTQRGFRANRRLWCSWVVSTQRAGSLLFVGDSGTFPGFREIGERLGPFRATILPVGAYEPRWFMAPFHMNPEEAVDAYRALGGKGAFIGSHWGTFRLTDEDPLEPPGRVREAWRDAGLPEERLHLPGIGGTVEVGAAG